MNDKTKSARAKGLTIGAAGIAAIAAVEPAMAQHANEVMDAGAAVGAPNWVEPLLQGLVAILTILLQFFGGNKKKRK